MAYTPLHRTPRCGLSHGREPATHRYTDPSGRTRLYLCPQCTVLLLDLYGGSVSRLRPARRRWRNGRLRHPAMG